MKKLDQSTDEKNLSHPPTSMDVARLAGVSRATVSYVLNGVPDSRISEETKERVLSAVAQLGYIPHKMARSLRSGRSDLVILPFFDWPYNQSSLAFLQDLAIQLERLDYSVLFRFFRSGDKKMVAKKIAELHPVGVILVSADELDDRDVSVLFTHGVRAVLAYEGSPDSSIPAIDVDVTSVGICVGEYLRKKGHKHIAVIVPRDERILKLGLKRLEGVIRATHNAGIAVDRVDLDYNTVEAAALAAKWKSEDRPTAVFTYNDEYAMLVMSVLQDVGLSIPADIALVGCDDLPICEMLRPRLTSVDISEHSPAMGIAEYFDRMIQSTEEDSPPHIALHSRLVIRESG